MLVFNIFYATAGLMNSQNKKSPISGSYMSPFVIKSL